MTILEILEILDIPRWKVFCGYFDSNIDRFFARFNQKGME